MWLALHCAAPTLFGVWDCCVFICLAGHPLLCLPSWLCPPGLVLPPQAPMRAREGRGPLARGAACLLHHVPAFPCSYWGSALYTPPSHPALIWLLPYTSLEVGTTPSPLPSDGQPGQLPSLHSCALSSPPACLPACLPHLYPLHLWGKPPHGGGTQSLPALGNRPEPQGRVV